jgi:hypothetical protein
MRLYHYEITVRRRNGEVVSSDRVGVPDQEYYRSIDVPEYCDVSISLHYDDGATVLMWVALIGFLVGWFRFFPSLCTVW